MNSTPPCSLWTSDLLTVCLWKLDVTQDCQEGSHQHSVWASQPALWHQTVDKCEEGAPCSPWILSSLFPQTARMQRIKQIMSGGELMGLFIERLWRTAHFCKAVYVTAGRTVLHDSSVTASHPCLCHMASDFSLSSSKTIPSSCFISATATTHTHTYKNVDSP